jgi:hypothetical protein
MVAELIHKQGENEREKGEEQGTVKRIVSTNLVTYSLP